MFIKLLSRKIQEKLKARERALAWRTNQANQNNVDGTLKPSDVINRSTFVRMCSNKDDITQNKIISGGLISSDGKMKFGYSQLYSKTRNQGDRPVAGIKNIEVSYMGDFKGIRKATINWSANSNDELSELTPHFLSLGQTVIVDWGWTSKKSKGLTRDLGVAPFITFDSEGSVKVKQDIFQNPQEIIQEAGGDYDAIGGTVSNFEYTLRTDGGYDCVTYITALGSTLYKKPMDKSGNKTDEVSDETGVTQTNFDGLINTLINLRDIIVYDILGVEYSSSWFTKRAYSKLRDNVSEFAGEEKNESKVIYSENILDYGEFTALVDSKENPNIMWILRPNSNDDIFVKWGWMEDQLLNRYISYMGGDDKEIKLTIRSIDTVLHTEGDKEGQPISTKGLSPKDKKKYGLEDIPEEYLGKVVKTPTLIRNSKLLYPINPFKFFNVEKLPNQSNVESAGLLNNLFASSFFKMLQKIKELFLTTGGEAGKYKAFQFDDDLSFGKLRDMWVNIKEIQSAFGVKEDGSVTPIGTLETGIDNLYTALNSNFHNYWDFALVADPYDSTNLKVIDKRTSPFGSQNYTTYQGRTDDEDGKNNHKVQKLGIYKFPSYKIGSIVKNQNMTFKIPDSMQQSILFSANLNKGEYKPVSHINNPDLARLFNFEKKDIEYTDRYLKDIKTPYHSKKEKTTTITIGEELDVSLLQTKIGSYGTNHNSKIGFGAGKGPITINPKAVWWKRWTGTDIQKPEAIEEGLSDRKPIVRFQINQNSEIATFKETTVDKQVGKAPELIPNFTQGAGKDAELLIIQKATYKTFTAVDKFKQIIDPNKTLFYTMSDADYTPVMKNDAATVITNFLNKNNPSLIVPTELSLEVDGIGGIMPGDIIQTDYIQPIYNKTLYRDGLRQGPFTYFQIVESNQKVDSSGWTTDISTKMRLNNVIIDEGTTTDKPIEKETIVDTTPESINSEDTPDTTPLEKPITTVINMVQPDVQKIQPVVGKVPFAKTYNEVIVENAFEPGVIVTVPKKKLPAPTSGNKQRVIDAYGRYLKPYIRENDPTTHIGPRRPPGNRPKSKQQTELSFIKLFGKVASTYGPTAIFYWDDSWGPNQQLSGFYPAFKATDDRYARTLWFIAKGELFRDLVKTVGSTIGEIGKTWKQINKKDIDLEGNYYVVGNGKNSNPGPKYIIDNIVKTLPIGNYPSPNTSNTIRINQKHPATGLTGNLDVDVTDIKG